MYEYACHEGNYGLLNIMTGARVEELAEPAEGSLELWALGFKAFGSARFRLLAFGSGLTDGVSVVSWRVRGCGSQSGWIVDRLPHEWEPWLPPGRPALREVRSRDFLQQPDEPGLVRGRQDHDPRALLGQEPLLVGEVVVQGDERATQLARRPKMLEVTRSSERVVVHDGQHVPPETVAHVADDARRHVGVRVDAWPRDQSLDVRA